MSCMPWLSTGCMRRHAHGTESTAEPSDLTTQHIQQRSDNFVHSSNRWRWKLQRTAAVAFISCWLDYCTSLLYGLPNTLLRLSLCRMSLHDWSVAHNAVIISCQYYANSISNTPEFKMACLARQSLPRQAPLYLADDSHLVSDSIRRSLWSADVLTCMMPRTLSSYGVSHHLLAILQPAVNCELIKLKPANQPWTVFSLAPAVSKHV